jgi:hypothetical protein
VFGEAIAFYTIEGQPTKRTMVVYNPLTKVTQPLGQIKGKWDHSLIHALDLSSIIDIVGIWEAKSNVYILQKHPALAMLSAEELGIAEEENIG